MSLKIGSKHPIEKTTSEARLSLAKENKEFLDVIFYNTSKSKDYPKSWEKANLRYGIYVEANIPFFLIDFPQEGKSYAMAINFYDISTNERASWLKETESTMNLFLLNVNNIIEAMRTINVSTPLASEIRKIGQNQLATYKDSSTVQAAISQVIAQKNTATMINKGKMISLLQI
ncbi:MAG: hypothetical protein OHK0057_14470 [Thermoflexibacter sp.]